MAFLGMICLSTEKNGDQAFKICGSCCLESHGSSSGVPMDQVVFAYEGTTEDLLV